ncbi:hypothetical protein BH11PLA1_BH11PLA1_21870 [soil metagenome]
MRISRHFTLPASDPFATATWVKRSSRITNPDGSVVFQMDDAEVPSTWSQLATDIMVSKYFRKAGVPRVDALGKPMLGADGKVVTGPETSAKQVIHRLAGCWRHWGETHGYFDGAEDAQAFYDELAYMLVHQVAAPNSPQWFNTGLNFAYGIDGPAQGHFIADHATGEVALAPDAYTHPQPHACFIQSVDDDLVNAGGIMDLWTREARLFKYGSGTGTNFSKLRGENEKLAGGGKSSGLMSWLRIGDRAAGAIKSGGTTRRAAKMVCLDMDHPDIEQFIWWKVREEIKVAAMVEGMKTIPADQKDLAAKLGLRLDYDFNGEAYATVSGQNSNNSVRISDEFFAALDSGAEWKTFNRTSGKVARTFKAETLWEDIAYAAWRCADPGMQYDTTINAWHTCPAAGRINASNPCSEYMFLDNTACNLASINLIKLYDVKTREFDVKAYEHAIDLWTMVLEISVLMAAFPSEEIARLSWRYRTLGLGYANLGSVLMQAGIAYDSDEARTLAGCFSAVLTGRSYRQSALMAKQMGTFAGYEADRENMLRVMRNHRRAAMGIERTAGDWEGLNAATRPVPINHAVVNSRAMLVGNAREIARHAVDAWDDAYELGLQHGYRNAQTTVIAPTGTIGLLMDCDTTGVEPDFALVKFKKLAGGGYFKIANASVRPALEALGYSDQQIKGIMAHLLGTLTTEVAVPGREGETLRAFLLGAGLTGADVQRIDDALPSTFELSFAFSAWGLGDDALKRAGVNPVAAKADGAWNLLAHLGLARQQISALNDTICGRQTIEGAPQLKAEHLPVFDCANRCGKYGKRFIAPEGHIRMMAAVQPFISGAISKTINLPNEATVEDCKRAYRMSWELGLKANALYRDGCKLSQPLSTSSESKEEKADAAAKVEAEAAAGKPGAKTAVHAGAGGAGSEGATGRGGERREEKCAPMIAAGGNGVPPAKEVEASLVEAALDGFSREEPTGARQVQIVERPMRRRLPDTRASITHKFNIAGHEGYLTVGLYDDGQPGELFITMAKEGSTTGGLMDSIGTATSVALQYGVPLESLVNKFTHQRFEPAGITANREIPFAKSLVDYIFRWMGIQFITGYREANTPNRGEPYDAPVAGMSPQMVEPRRGMADAASGRITFGDGATGRRPETGAAHVRRDEGGGAAGHVHVVKTTTVTDVDVAFDTRQGRGGKPTESVLGIAMRAQGDGPACPTCGTITIRNGTCYKCVNCGNSLGCS